MKLDKKYIITIVATLAVGLLLGRMFFSPESEATHDHELEADANGIWTCSMHPQIRQNEPGSCPICGMALIPLDDAEEGGAIEGITMSENAIKLANIITAKVGDNEQSKSIRMTGKVQEDERLRFTQASHIPGRLESLQVNFTGELVKKGQLLGKIYSPELVNAQNELLEAKKLETSNPALFESAKQKLRNWKLSETQINEVITSERVVSSFPIIAERSGIVNEKMVNIGDYVMRGQSLFNMTDLSKVWVLFDVYEQDLQWAKVGATVGFTINSLPGEDFEGKVTYIDPVLNAQTRVAKVRVEIPNNKGLLKPEMLASGVLQANAGSTSGVISVPKSAVMWTGKRSVVYVKVAADKGLTFVLRDVTLGADLGDDYEIKEGLIRGEEVAVNGTFSIDAAAQLAGKRSMMSPTEEESGETENTINIVKHTQQFEVEKEFKEQVKAVFDAYLPFKDRLVASDFDGALRQASSINNKLEKVDMRLVKGEAHNSWMEQLKVLNQVVSTINKANNLEETRQLLSPLSDQLYHVLKQYKITTNAYRQYCPMAMNDKGAFWLSDSEEIRNPYFGDAMLSCGEVEEELE